ncbi:MAG TPA: hypothetical protein VM716_11705 [Gemmatimonadales bacterium]|nr:hypothetical protein [Gemmatimonadales bacterium]
MRKWIGSAVLVMMLAALPVAAHAQRRAAPRPAARSAERPSFGLELNWSSDVDLGIGGRGVVPLGSLFPRTPLDGIASFDIFFPSKTAPVTSASYWEINGDVAYRFTVPSRSTLRPYAGSGLNIAHYSSTAGGVSTSATKAGLNLLGGVTFKLKRSTLVPFAEARGEVGGGKTFILTGGLRF